MDTISSNVEVNLGVKATRQSGLNEAISSLENIDRLLKGIGSKKVDIKFTSNIRDTINNVNELKLLLGSLGTSNVRLSAGNIDPAKVAQQASQQTSSHGYGIKPEQVVNVREEIEKLQRQAASTASSINDLGKMSNASLKEQSEDLRGTIERINALKKLEQGMSQFESSFKISSGMEESKESLEGRKKAIQDELEATKKNNAELEKRFNLLQKQQNDQATKAKIDPKEYEDINNKIKTEKESVAGLREEYNKLQNLISSQKGSEREFTARAKQIEDEERKLKRLNEEREKFLSKGKGKEEDQSKQQERDSRKSQIELFELPARKNRLEDLKKQREDALNTLNQIDESKVNAGKRSSIQGKLSTEQEELNKLQIKYNESVKDQIKLAREKNQYTEKDLKTEKKKYDNIIKIQEEEIKKSRNSGRMHEKGFKSSIIEAELELEKHKAHRKKLDEAKVIDPSKNIPPLQALIAKIEESKIKIEQLKASLASVGGEIPTGLPTRKEAKQLVSSLGKDIIEEKKKVESLESELKKLEKPTETLKKLDDQIVSTTEKIAKLREEQSKAATTSTRPVNEKELRDTRDALLEQEEILRRLESQRDKMRASMQKDGTAPVVPVEDLSKAKSELDQSSERIKALRKELSDLANQSKKDAKTYADSIDQVSKNIKEILDPKPRKVPTKDANKWIEEKPEVNKEQLNAAISRKEQLMLSEKARIESVGSRTDKLRDQISAEAELNNKLSQSYKDLQESVKQQKTDQKKPREKTEQEIELKNIQDLISIGRARIDQLKLLQIEIDNLLNKQNQVEGKSKDISSGTIKPGVNTEGIDRLNEALSQIINKLAIIDKGMKAHEGSTFGVHGGSARGTGTPNVVSEFEGHSRGPYKLTETSKQKPVMIQEGDKLVEKIQTTSTTNAEYQQIIGSVVQLQKVTEAIAEIDGRRQKILSSTVNIQEDLNATVERGLRKAELKKLAVEEMALNRLGKALAQAQQHEKDLEAQGYKKIGTTTSEKDLLGQRYALEKTTWVGTVTNEMGQLERKIIEVDHATGKLKENLTNIGGRAQIKFEDNQAFKGLKQDEQRLKLLERIIENEKQVEAARKSGYIHDPLKSTVKTVGDILVPIDVMVKKLADGRDMLLTFSPLADGVSISFRQNAEEAKKTAEALREQKRIQDELNKQQIVKQKLSEFQQRAHEGGYKIGPPDLYENVFTEKSGEIVRAHRVVREGLAKYRIELLKFNTLTGEITTNSITGAAAAKFLGDSIFRAGEKVAIWTVSTAILFTAMRTVKQFSSEIKYLEANTVFMARVSNRLVTAFKDEDDRFKQKLAMAERVTAKTIELTTVTGGLADEAQRSAVTFLRAGNSEQDVVYGVAASLMAARIAQLGITESTDLLISSIRQFNIETKQIIPTLDTLNELSNNWKVSTNDLLQSISRAGSVVASHNGTIAEFASLTAVVAQRTSRTGSEIGNAMKTIESRMDRSDAARKVFDQLGISTSNFTGEAKSLAKVIFELSLGMDQLTSSEERQITVDIAGIRQRNFLVAALEESVTQVIAMNGALQNSNSAYSEFLESSRTLESAIERLKSRITAVSQEIRGPFGMAMTGSVNTLNTMLTVVQTFPNLFMTLPAGIAMFWLLRQAVQRVAVAYGDKTKSLMTANIARASSRKDIAWEIGMLRLNTQETLNNAAAQGKLAMVKKAALASATPFMTIGNAITLGIGAAITALVLWQSRMGVRMKLLEEERTLIDLGISAENKKQESVLYTNWALNTLNAEMLFLNRRFKEGSVDVEKYNERMEELEEKAKRVAKSMKIDIEGSFADPDVFKKVQEELQIQFNKSWKEKKIYLELDLAKSEFTVSEIQGKIEKLFNREQPLMTPLPPGHHTDLGPSVEHKLEMYKILSEFNPNAKRITEENIDEFQTFLYKKINELDPTGKLRLNPRGELILYDKMLTFVTELSKEYKTFKKQLDEANEALNKTKDILKEADKLDTPEKQLRYKELVYQLRQMNHETDIHLDKIKKMGEFHSAIGRKDSYALLLQRYKDLNSSVHDYTNKLKELTELHEGLEDKTELENWIKQLEKVQDELNKTKLAITKVQEEQRKGYMESSLSNRMRLEDSMYANQLKRAHVYRTTMTGILDIESKIHQQRVISSRIKAFENDLLNEKDDTKKRAIISVMQKELNRLKDLELEKSISILDTETEILKTRREQVKEALKAIGALDEEGKMRLLAQSQYIANNPGKKFTMSDLFHMSSDSVNMLNQFHQASIATPEENANDRLARFLIQSGIGLTNELVNASKELKNIASGLNNSDLIKRGYKHANEYERQARVAGGDDALSQERFDASKLTSLNIDNQVLNLVVDNNAFDLSPLIDTFNNFLIHNVKAEFERMYKSMVETEDSYKPRMKLPR
jgi:TP901 family phage tail tape measure protein